MAEYILYVNVGGFNIYATDTNQKLHKRMYNIADKMAKKISKKISAHVIGIPVTGNQETYLHRIDI